MARYETPQVFYQTGINADTAVEVTHIKSLTWANRTNNNGNFELTIPIDSELTPFNPVRGAYIRLSPGDTIMQIEKKEKIFDEWGNYWYKLGGRTKQANDDLTRQAQNEGWFFRYIFDGVGSERYSGMINVGTPVTTINKGDITHSSTYEDDLGGFEEELHPGAEAFSWSSTVISQPRPNVTTVNASIVVSVSVPTTTYNPSNGRHEFDGGTFTLNDIVSISTHNVFTTDSTIQVTAGVNSGRNGRSDVKRSSYQWITNDTQTDETVYGPTYNWSGWWPGQNRQTFGSSRGFGIIRKRTVSVRSDATMRSLMNGELSPGSEPAIPPKIRNVKGGHEGYSFGLKSKGDVEKRYKVDFNLGDTIRINDTRLNVVYTGVVSGAVETIDGNGYSVDIEIGTLGATLEQRIQRVI